MLRKLCTVDKWSKLSLISLREELAKRGLKRAGSREELVQRLKENEDTGRYEGIKLETEEEDLGNASLNSLSKSYLMQEILKRKPDFSAPLKYSKKHLIESLSSMILDDKGKNVNDLKTLVLQSTSNLEEITLQQLFQVLEKHKDPYSISQFDMNVLLNSDPYVMIPI